MLDVESIFKCLFSHQFWRWSTQALGGPPIQAICCRCFHSGSSSEIRSESNAWVKLRRSASWITTSCKKSGDDLKINPTINSEPDYLSSIEPNIPRAFIVLDSFLSLSSLCSPVFWLSARSTSSPSASSLSPAPFASCRSCRSLQEHLTVILA